MDNIFSAEAMRQLSTDSRQLRQDEELVNLIKEITRVAKSGHYSIRIQIEFFENVNKLNKLGFSIRLCDGQLSSITNSNVIRYYEVSWDGE